MDLIDWIAFFFIRKKRYEENDYLSCGTRNHSAVSNHVFGSGTKSFGTEIYQFVLSHPFFLLFYFSVIDSFRSFSLIVEQQPKQSRMCGVGEKSTLFFAMYAYNRQSPSHWYLIPSLLSNINRRSSSSSQALCFQRRSTDRIVRSPSELCWL